MYCLEIISSEKKKEMINLTSVSARSDESQENYYLYAIFGGTIILTGIIGNALVIVYFGFKEKRKASYDTFITLLAISDFAGCILVFAQWLEVIAFHLPFSFESCSLLLTLSSWCVCVSSYLIMGMAFERYRGITRPLSKKIHRKHVYFYCLVVCIGWTLYGMPAFLVYSTRGEQCTYHGGIGFFSADEHFAYIVVFGTIRDVIPLHLMVFIYVKIRRELKKHEVLLETATTSRRNRTALKTLKMLILSFIICVSFSGGVNAAILGIFTYFPAIYSPWMRTLIAFQTCVLSLNNAVNCFVYAGYRKNFRTYLLALFRVRTQRGNLQSQTTRDYGGI